MKQRTPAIAVVLGQCVLLAACSAEVESSEPIGARSDVVRAARTGSLQAFRTLGERHEHGPYRHERERFVPFGDLPGGDHASVAYAVSANGHVVVGYGSEQLGTRAVRWSVDHPQLTKLPGAAPSEARGVSADGNVVAGWVTSDQDMRRAALWRQQRRVAVLPFPSDIQGPEPAAQSEALALSGEGALTVGVVYWSTGPLDPRGVAWGKRGQVQTLSGYSIATATNEDGTVTVGFTLAGRSGGWNQAVKNSQPLPFPDTDPTCNGASCAPACITPTACSARAFDVSADGGVIVGSATVTSLIAVAWTIDDSGTATAKVLPSNGPAEALAISADGSTIVGYETEGDTQYAVEWTTVGRRRIAERLAAARALPRGWSLQVAHDVSADGRVIVGEGTNPDGELEGWIAVLPDPKPGNEFARPSRRLTLDAFSAP